MLGPLEDIYWYDSYDRKLSQSSFLIVLTSITGIYNDSFIIANSMKAITMPEF